MPIYEYRCLDCHKVSEKLQGWKDPNPPCPFCGGSLEKLFKFGGLGIIYNWDKK